MKNLSRKISLLMVVLISTSVMVLTSCSKDKESVDDKTSKIEYSVSYDSLGNVSENDQETERNTIIYPAIATKLGIANFTYTFSLKGTTAECDAKVKAAGDAVVTELKDYSFRSNHTITIRNGENTVFEGTFNKK